MKPEGRVRAPWGVDGSDLPEAVLLHLGSLNKGSERLLERPDLRPVLVAEREAEAINRDRRKFEDIPSNPFGDR